MKRPLPWTTGLLALVLGGCLLPQPQTSRATLQISGRVVDAETGKPLPSARVWVSGYLKTKTSTNKEGLFMTQPDHALALATTMKSGSPDDLNPKKLVVQCGGYAIKEIDVSSLLSESDPAIEPVRELKDPVQLQPKKSSP